MIAEASPYGVAGLLILVGLIHNADLERGYNMKIDPLGLSAVFVNVFTVLGATGLNLSGFFGLF